MFDSCGKSVEDDGSVREVSKDDEDYLNTQFHPTDRQAFGL